MRWNLSCVAANRALPFTAWFLLACVGAPGAMGQQPAAAAPTATVPAAAAPTADQLRAQRLHNEASQLNQTVQQLQVELHKAGRDKLSLQAVRLAQQAQWLSRQIQAELEQP